MQLKIGEFGPIRKADVRIKPLTVVIGRNCVGKSYFADLLFAILTCGSTAAGYSFVDFVLGDSEQQDFLKLSRSIGPKINKRDFVRLVLNFLLDKYNKRLERNLKTQLESIFGMEVKDLVRLGSEESSIEFQSDTGLTIGVAISKKNGISVHLKTNLEEIVDNVLKNEQISSSISASLKRVRRLKRASHRIQALIMTCIRLADMLQKVVRLSEGKSSVYLVPAGRAGLLEGYYTVQSALLSLSPIAPIRGITMPPIPGPAAEFYKIYLALRGRKGPFASIAKRFEDLMGGSILIKRLGEQRGRTTITFSFKSDGQKGEIDIIHAASGVKELATLYLIIYEMIKEGDLLIIEEPESHLHPGAQIKFVEVLAVLVSRGVRVFLTTHSDLILRKLAQLTGVYRLEKIRKARLASFSPEDTAVYLFKDSRTGSSSKLVPLTEHGSFDELPTFDDVMQELYEKGMTLQSVLQMK